MNLSTTSPSTPEADAFWDALSREIRLSWLYEDACAERDLLKTQLKRATGIMERAGLLDESRAGNRRIGFAPFG